MTTLAGFKCNACGSTDFTFAHNPPQNADIMTCSGCKREFGTLGEVQALAEQHLVDNEATIEANFKTVQKPKLSS